MKHPTYARFMNEIERLISGLSKDELKQKVVDLAESQDMSERNNFIGLLRQGVASGKNIGDEKPILAISPKDLIKRIKEFKKRIDDGEFFDEEENWRAYEGEEYGYRRNRYNDYYGDEIDFSTEPYVLEMIELLSEAKKFFRKDIIKTAYEAYGMLFDIFDDTDYYGGDERFIYGFSFDSAIDNQILKEHRTIYLRCIYFKLVEDGKFKELCNILSNENKILLSDIIEIARTPLPKLDKVVTAAINYLRNNPQKDKYLADVLFVKGGIEELKIFAYENADKHPPIFSCYYKQIKEQKFSDVDLLQTILDGIKIIPQKYCIRSLLALDLIEMCKNKKDKKNNLLLGYATAFYSNPTLKNLTYFLEFIISEQVQSEQIKLKKYLAQKDIDKVNPEHISFFEQGLEENIYSLALSNIDRKTLVIGRYILDNMEPLLCLVSPKKYLGFSGTLKYVAVIATLTLKSIAGQKNVCIIDKLVSHYCLDERSDERIILMKLISDKASLYSHSDDTLKILEQIEKLAVNRVAHILKNKLRGGYESACLLLVACAETNQILTGGGNKLLRRIDDQYKRFSAFRGYLKEMTSMSKHLMSISKPNRT